MKTRDRSSEPGLIVTVLGFAYLVWNLASAYVLDAFVPGWASLIGVTMILGGSQLLFIGLIGQYLARVFEELKGRPLYIFKQEPRPTGGLAAEGRAAAHSDIGTAREGRAGSNKEELRSSNRSIS